jgi:hypothetical protein
MDYTNLESYVGADTSDSAYVEQCWGEALSLVSAYVGTVDPVQVIPAEILDRAALEVGSELYHRRQAPNGVSQFASFDGAPIRVARDPMLSAYPLLQRYLGLGVA